MNVNLPGDYHLVFFLPFKFKYANSFISKLLWTFLILNTSSSGLCASVYGCGTWVRVVWYINSWLTSLSPEDKSGCDSTWFRQRDDDRSGNKGQIKGLAQVMVDWIYVCCWYETFIFLSFFKVLRMVHHYQHDNLREADASFIYLVDWMYRLILILIELIIRNQRTRP